MPPSTGEKYVFGLVKNFGDKIVKTKSLQLSILMGAGQRGRIGVIATGRVRFRRSNVLGHVTTRNSEELERLAVTKVKSVY